VGSGKLMNEDRLRTGQLDHLVYGIHLLAWLLIGAVLIWHVAAVISRGGTPLARSMFNVQMRPGDQPRHRGGVRRPQSVR
jgi:hypothetical protein